jgi:hypothetical protein
LLASRLQVPMTAVQLVRAERPNESGGAGQHLAPCRDPANFRSTTESVAICAACGHVKQSAKTLALWRLSPRDFS